MRKQRPRKVRSSWNGRCCVPDCGGWARHSHWEFCGQHWRLIPALTKRLLKVAKRTGDSKGAFRCVAEALGHLTDNAVNLQPKNV